MGWEPTNNPSIRHRVENPDLLNLIVFHGLPDSNKEDKLQKIENKSLCKKSLPCQTDLSDQLTHAVLLDRIIRGSTVSCKKKVDHLCLNSLFSEFWPENRQVTRRTFEGQGVKGPFC